MKAGYGIDTAWNIFGVDKQAGVAVIGTIPEFLGNSEQRQQKLQHMWLFIGTARIPQCIVFKQPIRFYLAISMRAGIATNERSKFLMLTIFFIFVKLECMWPTVRHTVCVRNDNM